MKFLVLGSSGQIGAHLVDFLHEQGAIVQTYDIVENSSMDLRNPSPQLDLFVREADFVFFLAFDVGGSTYLKKYQNTYEFLDNNVRLMKNAFDTLKRWNKPFIFASSQMSNMSYSSYGVLKALGEYYTKILNGVVVKFWNVYGVEHDPDKTHVITDFVKMALTDKVIRMKTDGKEERQFLYARDCSEALYLIATHFPNTFKDKELHITSFKWTSILEVAETISHLCLGTTVVEGELKDSVQHDKRNEPNPFILSYWQPKTSLEDGIKQIIKHYKK